MKALVLRNYNRFEYEEVPEPKIRDDEVLIQVEACGICGSDVHGMDGSTGRRQPPVIMGHEASGVIAEVGADVSEWRKDERVTFDSTLYCGECPFCRKGQINLCDNRRVLGVSCDDYRQDGAFAEYVAVPRRILYRLPEEVSFEQAAMVEAVSIALHAVERSPFSVDDTAVIVGSGMIGLLIIQVLRQKGCAKIIALDLDEERLNLASKLGADVVIKSDKDSTLEEVLGITEGRGADIGFEVVGIGPTIKMAVQSLRKAGSLTLVGNLSPGVELPLQAVVTREISLYGSCASAGEYPACLNMIARKRIDVDSLVSAVAPLEQGADWFERLCSKEKGLMKVILRP